MYQIAIADTARCEWLVIARELPDPAVYDALTVTSDDQVQVWSVLLTDRSATWLKLAHPEWQPHPI